MKNKFAKLYIFILLSSTTLLPFTTSAQCAMCKRVAETNYQQQQAAQRKGRSLNNGILYLLSIPYIIGAVGVGIWYKNRKKADQD